MNGWVSRGGLQSESYKRSFPYFLDGSERLHFRPMLHQLQVVSLLQLCTSVCSHQHWPSRRFCYPSQGALGRISSEKGSQAAGSGRHITVPKTEAEAQNSLLTGIQPSNTHGPRQRHRAVHGRTRTQSRHGGKASHAIPQGRGSQLLQSDISELGLGPPFLPGDSPFCPPGYSSIFSEPQLGIPGYFRDSRRQRVHTTQHRA